MSEEDRSEASELPSVYWLIDPLDGTFNYSRGIPHCCVSIALMEGSTPRLGVIYDFLHERVFSGANGIAASLNGQKLLLNPVPKERAQMVVATGFPVKRILSDEGLLHSFQKLRGFKKVRMFGSASSSLSFVASGNVDVYWEESIMLWDVAAGVAISEAAGAKYSITPVDGKFTSNVICSPYLDVVEFLKESDL